LGTAISNTIQALVVELPVGVSPIVKSKTNKQMVYTIEHEDPTVDTKRDGYIGIDPYDNVSKVVYRGSPHMTKAKPSDSIGFSSLEDIFNYFDANYLDHMMHGAYIM